MSVLSLPRTLLARICLHAEEQYPNECCGVLLGASGVDGWTVADVVRTDNAVVDSPDTQYAIAPLDLVKILHEARSLNLEIAGFYHSHPDHPATWSQTDLAEAHWLACSYLITEVTQGRARATNSFLLSGTREEDKRFIPERIELLG
jgi:proteasome lid subunit RPN8/RPN11